ncbi:MAG TPA: ABC transporter ATP-binding protein [Paraburkholderia sp.]|nr:ABC transporter ATP-binding protein [Paraburkholderia sp.]
MKLAPVPITLSNCAKTFRGTRVLEPLELAIGAGETLVLLGPSGCGKTTTLRIIAGLETPDAGGRVCFGDDDVTALPIERRAVGMVFQNYALFPNLSVRGNIGYGLKIRRVAADETRRRVDELLAMMRLTEHADKAVDQLSGGQRQRVALARAIAPRPRVLLLDEPLTALDARLRDALRGEMNALLRELGITTVYVTHDQAEAMELGDRIVVMSAGRIEQTGTPRDIYYRPANRAVAQFIGTVNRLAGSWRDGLLTTAGGAVPAAYAAACAPTQQSATARHDTSMQPGARAQHGASTQHSASMHHSASTQHSASSQHSAPVQHSAPTQHSAPVAAQPAAQTVHPTHEVFFRPEDAWLADPSSAQLRGTVEHAAFLGERTRLTIGGAAPDALIVDVAGRVELARGTPVGLSIAPHALLALS